MRSADPMKRLVLALTCVAAATSFERAASAAAQAPCAPARVTPTAATIPANLPAFGYSALEATANDIHLVATSAGNVDVPLTLGPAEGGLLKIVPSTPLTVGATYRLTFESFCSYGAFKAQEPIDFTVAAAAPLPTKVGAAPGVPTVSVKDLGTSRFTIETSYELDAEMRPWASVYRLGLLVDDRAVETKVTLSAAGDRATIMATGWCDDALASKNQHALKLRARLPFTATLESPITTLDFACPAPNIKPPPPSTATPTPTVTPSPSASAANPASGSGSSGGCSASPTAVHGSVASASAWVLASVFALARRRRVRRLGFVKGGN